MLQICSVSVYTISISLCYCCLFCGSDIQYFVVSCLLLSQLFRILNEAYMWNCAELSYNKEYYIILHKSSLIVVADTIRQYLSQKNCYLWIPTYASVRRSYTISLCLFSRFYFSFLFFLYSFGRIVTVD